MGWISSWIWPGTMRDSQSEVTRSMVIVGKCGDEDGPIRSRTILVTMAR